MDKELKEFLLSLEITEKQIETMKSNFPALGLTTLEHAKENIEILEEYGYPSFDIDSLIIANPFVIIVESELLVETLDKIEDDVEEYIKNDPFFI